MAKLGDWFRWAMAVLVIPLIIWGIKLEVDKAVLTERVAEMGRQHTQDMSCLENQVKEAEDIQKDVRANNGQLIRLTTLMDTMSKSVDEVKGLLRDL